MKKLSLLIAALLLVGASAFSVEFATTAAVSGEASVTFGVDLEAGASGFANAKTSKITLVLAAEEVVTAGEDPVSGYIEIKVAEEKFESSDATELALHLPTVSVEKAGIKFSDALSLNILGLSDEINKASTGQGKAVGVTLVGASVTDVKPAHSQEHQGIAAAITLDGVATIDIGVSSVFDWTAADVNTQNEYTFYTNFGLTAVEGLTLEAAFNYTMDDAATDSFGLGVKGGYTVSVVDILVGMDMIGSNLQLGAGVALKLGDATKVNPFIDPGDDVTYTEGLGVAFGFGNTTTNSFIDLTASFFDGALIPVVDLLVLLELGDLTGGTAMDMAIGADLSLDLDGLKPFANFIMVNKDGATDTDDYLQIKGGITVDKITGSVTFKSTTPPTTADELTVEVKAEKIIPLTDFTLKYTTADLGNHSGILTFETKVSM